MNVLIVDDVAANLKLLRFVLESDGHAVHEARDGVDALELLNRESIDVIISDILMPRMDGYRLCDEVRRTEQLKNIPFIFYTATYTSSGDERLCLDLGATKYMRKPAPAEELLAAVREVAGHQRVSAALRIPSRLDDAGVMKEYNERLVLKLEEKNAELSSTHDTLRRLLEHSPAVIYGLKLEGETVIPYLVSENVTRLLGFLVNETLHQEWWLKQVHPDDIRRALAGLTETLDEGMSRTEYRLCHKDGSYRWVEDNRRLVRDSSGVPVELSGVWTDITERKRAEEVLKESERRFRELLENMDFIAMILDRQGMVTFCNDHLLKLTGSTRDEVMGVDWFAHFIPASSPEVSRMFSANFDQGTIPAHYENPICTKSGEIREIFWNNTMLRDEGGKYVGVASIGEDVTERRRAEADLRKSEERFRELAENIQEVFWMSEPAKELILYVSPAYEKIWGRTCASLYANPRSWLDSIHPEDRERVLSARVIKRAGGKYDEQYRIVRPDGSVRWIHDRASPVRDGAGKVCRITGAAEDITERRQLEAQFRQAQKMEAIGTLAGGIAHDFNNILGVIGGYTELLKEMLNKDPEILENLDAVGLATTRATHLVRQILAFSRQEETQRQPIELAPVAGEAVKFLRATIPSTIEIQCAFTPEVPVVLADATQIHQILMNLGTNAWHAMKDRAGRLDIKLEDFTVDQAFADKEPRLHIGRYARLSVSDTGEGMTPATLSRIFEPFFTTKPVGKGTGLGLAVVHGIMHTHGGLITVASQPGHGTVFQLYFPAHASGVAVAEVKTPATGPTGHGERILYVDDEVPLVLLGKKILEHLGYVVEPHTNVATALALVRSDPNRFDLVITDQTMPEMTGLDFARELAQIRPDLPVILTTGYAGQITSEHLRAAGIRELLLKPPTIRAVGAIVHRILADQSTPRP